MPVWAAIFSTIGRRLRTTFPFVDWRILCFPSSTARNCLCARRFASFHACWTRGRARSSFAARIATCCRPAAIGAASGFVCGGSLCARTFGTSTFW